MCVKRKVCFHREASNFRYVFIGIYIFAKLSIAKTPIFVGSLTEATENRCHLATPGPRRFGSRSRFWHGAARGPACCRYHLRQPRHSLSEPWQGADFRLAFNSQHDANVDLPHAVALATCHLVVFVVCSPLEWHHRRGSAEGSRQLIAQAPFRHSRLCCRRAGCA